MADFVALVTPPILVGPNDVPAEGSIFAKTTSTVALPGKLVVPFQAEGKIVAGQFQDLKGGPYRLPVTPEGVAVEIVVQLFETKPGTPRSKFYISRTVAVPNQNTVTWDALVDVVPVESGADYDVPTWVTQLLTDAALAAAPAIAARDAAVTARNQAVAAAESVPTEAQLTATIAAAVEPVAEAVQAGSSASRYAGIGIAALGDSITANFGNTSTSMPDSYLAYACIDAGGRLPWRGAYATGGYTVEQIRDTHLPSVLALSPAPAACVVLAGTNNTATSSSVAVHIEIWEALLAAGIRPIAATIPPRGNSGDTGVATYRANADKMNRAIRSEAARRGIDVVDFNRVLANPATGGWKTGLVQSDLIHPSFLGVRKMGAALATVLAKRFPEGTPPVAMGADEFGNLIGAAGMFLTDVLTSNNNVAGDGIADNWRNLGGALNTTALVDEGGIRWQRITVPTTGGGTNLQYSGTAPSLNAAASAGDVIEVAYLVKATGYEANLIAPTGTTGGTGPTWSVLVEYEKSDLTYATVVRAPYTMHGDADGAVWARGVLPAGGTGKLRVSITTATVPTVSPVSLSVAQLAVRNLTALGLAA